MPLDVEDLLKFKLVKSMNREKINISAFETKFNALQGYLSRLNGDCKLSLAEWASFTLSTLPSALLAAAFAFQTVSDKIYVQATTKQLGGKDWITATSRCPVPESDASKRVQLTKTFVLAAIDAASGVSDVLKTPRWSWCHDDTGFSKRASSRAGAGAGHLTRGTSGVWDVDDASGAGAGAGAGVVSATTGADAAPACCMSLSSGRYSRLEPWRDSTITLLTLE